MNPEMDAVTTCGNCRAPMPKELRFCRNCGFRLGEGSAEYTETVRFQNIPAETLANNNSAKSFPQGVGGPIAFPPGGKLKKRRGIRRMSGMTWMFLGLLIFFIAAGAFTAIIKPIRDNVRGHIAQQASRSYIGPKRFETTEGNSGVTFANVEPPGSPADKAGLVGGDIITTADGQPVHSGDEMMEILRRVPIGKTIDIVYIRDGETKNTKLTTFSQEDSSRLTREFAGRPAGIGRFGFDDDDTERVPIPGTNMFGVRLDDVSPSLPADMAGIKNGDIIIEFDGVPIRTPEELASRVRRAIPYEPVNVVLMRGGERLEIPVKMGRK
ncbi:MAG TPA: PDZ domain-containing protein [Pyrinomonadaceae bacterium]|jgi:C-terminal processing protease CtpA/Prc